ncbi:hypothetical protein [Haloarcula litorea]|uniref:hypothetical protein n=1 Tax=Haloarcula litorea TaxID=3032579 RepID=UPI0023E7BB96|nr:hypothetical protein [Halomicroarcula sp. GDY20]
MTPVSERRAPEGESPHVCPLCTHAEEEQRDLYVHLQVTHRKSELSEALIEAAAGDDGPPSGR